jgi:hypothetical protein
LNGASFENLRTLSDVEGQRLNSLNALTEAQRLDIPYQLG